MHARNLRISFAMTLAAISNAAATPVRSEAVADGAAGASLQIIAPLVDFR